MMSLSVILALLAIDLILSPKISGLVHKIRTNANPVIDSHPRKIRPHVNAPVNHFNKFMKRKETTIAISTQ